MLDANLSPPTNGRNDTLPLDSPPDVWAPQPGPQTAFLNCPCFEAVYGGARGGGKTDASLGDFAAHADEWGSAAKGLFLRRTYVALGPTIERAKEIYRPFGAVWSEQKSRFKWPNGAVLYFRYLERDQDADAYQGHDYSRIYVEELTQFPNPAPLDKLKATLRSAHGVPTGFRATCNPGGPGHAWVKNRYIDAGPYQIVTDTFTNPFDGKPITSDRVFIPARLTDNPQLLNSDPRYVANLYKAGSAALVKAWLEGDWDVVEGAFFDNWSSSKHVLDPFSIPASWLRFRSFDWGSAAPFSVGWWAVAGEDHRQIPRGAIIRYREWYGASSPGKGLKLTTEQVASGIRERDAGDKLTYSVADPAIFAEDGGPSRAEVFARAGVHFKRADNKRVSGAGALGGWDEMRQRIRGRNGIPMLYVFSTCRDFIRTVPNLPHDPDRVEDIDTDSEDHVADEARYACMSRPWVPPADDKPVRRRRGLLDDDDDEADMPPSWKAA